MEDKNDKFLLFFSPEVNEQSNVFCCCSITTGATFISILMLLSSILYFYGAIYSVKSMIINLILGVIYGCSGLCLLISIFNLNYVFAKITYVLYTITICIRLAIDIVLFIIVFIYIIVKRQYLIYFITFFGLEAIELAIMSYFLYVIFCYLYLIQKKIGDKESQIRDALLKSDLFKENN